MKIVKPTKTEPYYYLNFTDNLFIHSIFEWEQLSGKWNWLTFHLIHIMFENEVMTGGFEFEFIIVGVGFRLRYNYNDKMEKIVEECEKEIS